MIVVGLTGGIGSGKTTVANFFKDLGVPVYFADEEAKKLMHTSKEIKQQLIAEFGKETFINGNLNRSYLASIVFNDSSKLQKLNSIVHPEVAKHFLSWVQKQQAPYVIQENAILYENNTASNFDVIITVTSPIGEKIDRVVKRDATTKKEVLARMNKQWDDEEKIALSDFVINNTNLKATRKQVLRIHKKLLSLSD
jgi:dephospho-CoA kinase